MRNKGIIFYLLQVEKGTLSFFFFLFLIGYVITLRITIRFVRLQRAFYFTSFSFYETLRLVLFPWYQVSFALKTKLITLDAILRLPSQFGQARAVYLIFSQLFSFSIRKQALLHLLISSPRGIIEWQISVI